ncbi:oligosaccharide flippase family protein [Candidatus Daviesbacteria bacterium]|nr:oligosaccharide flippase family protein [Candidatus Daviesbacteria bacterium]
MTGEIDFATIKKRTVSGIFTLTFRRIALQAISFASINLILARILPVETIGIFNIGTSLIAFFAFFSDIGLAASLIQKKDNITRQDLTTTFTIQQILIGVITLVIIALAPLLAQIYQLGDDGVWLIRALSIGFFLSSLKVVPAVVLERELKFTPLVTVEIVETLIFNAILVTLAFLNYGLTSFSLATIARGVSGTLLIYVIAPWKVGLGISRQSATLLLHFGIPYQANALLALVKDRVVPLVVAKMVGAVGIGYITWAQALAFLPLEFMNIIIRVTFPTFSRLQDQQDQLKGAIEKSLYVTTLVLYPTLAGILALSPSLVGQIVSSKWQPALPLIYLFACSTFWASISTTYTNALTAIGHVKTVLKLMVMWTVLTWILTPLLVWQFGFIGVAYTAAVISFSSVVTIVVLHRHVKIDLWSNINKQLVVSLLMGVALYILSPVMVVDWLTLMVAVLLGGLFYGLLMLIFDRSRLSALLKL